MFGVKSIVLTSLGNIIFILDKLTLQSQMHIIKSSIYNPGQNNVTIDYVSTQGSLWHDV